MLIYLLAFVGGVLTILSPCILPVLPFVFARADQPFRRSGLPLLAGMALTFSIVAIAAAFGGHWVVRLNQGGRYVAMLVFLVLGITLLFPSLAEALTRRLMNYLFRNRVNRNWRLRRLLSLLCVSTKASHE